MLTPVVELVLQKGVNSLTDLQNKLESFLSGTDYDVSVPMADIHTALGFLNIDPEDIKPTPYRRPPMSDHTPHLRPHSDPQHPGPQPDHGHTQQNDALWRPPAAGGPRGEGDDLGMTTNNPMFGNRRSGPPRGSMHA